MPDTTDTSSPLAPVPALRVVVDDARTGVTVVRAHGELDLAGVAHLRRHLDDALRALRHTVLDLAGLTFLASHGLRMLLQVDHEAHLQGLRFVVTGAEAAIVRRILTITAADRLLDLSGEPADTVAERLAAGPGDDDPVG